MKRIRRGFILIILLLAVYYTTNGQTADIWIQNNKKTTLAMPILLDAETHRVVVVPLYNLERYGMLITFISPGYVDRNTVIRITFKQGYQFKIMNELVNHTGDVLIHFNASQVETLRACDIEFISVTYLDSFRIRFRKEEANVVKHAFQTLNLRR